MQTRNLALAVASSLALMLAAPSAGADQKIKTKSNIKNDRVASACVEKCVDVGYAWARDNGATEAEDCDAANEEVAAGCRNFVLENMPAVPAEGPEHAEDVAPEGEVPQAAGEISDDTALAPDAAAESTQGN